MRGRTEDSVGSQAGEHLLAWPWEGSIILVGWEGVWSHFIWGKVVSATVALFSALGTDGLKASILVIEILRRLAKHWSKEMTGPLAYLIIQTTHVFAKKSNHSRQPHLFCKNFLRGLLFDSPWTMGDPSPWAMWDQSLSTGGLGGGGVNVFS